MKKNILKEFVKSGWEWLCQTKNNIGLISLTTLISLITVVSAKIYPFFTHKDSDMAGKGNIQTVSSVFSTDTNEYAQKEIAPGCAISLSRTKNVKMEGNTFEGFDCVVTATNSENLQMTGNVMR